MNSSLQLAAEPMLRGRVMALYAMVFLGSTAIGAPLIGLLAQVAGPRSGLYAGGAAALMAAPCGRGAPGASPSRPAHARSAPSRRSRRTLPGPGRSSSVG